MTGLGLDWDWKARGAAVAAAQKRLDGSREAARVFHDAIDAAWPPGFFDSLGRLKLAAGGPEDVEVVLGFLEADPIFFRSGYMADKALRWIDRQPLTPDQQQRLRAVLLDALDRRHRQYFRRFCHLARRQATPELRRGVEARLASPDFEVRARAQWMLDEMDEGARHRRY